MEQPESPKIMKKVGNLNHPKLGTIIVVFQERYEEMTYFGEERFESDQGFSGQISGNRGDRKDRKNLLDDQQLILGETALSITRL